MDLPLQAMGGRLAEKEKAFHIAEFIQKPGALRKGVLKNFAVTDILNNRTNLDGCRMIHQKKG